jgi:hypothetical protein
MAAPAVAVSTDFTEMNLADINVNRPDRLGYVFESPFIREMLDDGEFPVSPEENIVKFPVTPENYSRFQDRRLISEYMTEEETTNFIEFLELIHIDVPRYIYTYMDHYGELNIPKYLLERHNIEECVTRYMDWQDYVTIDDLENFKDRVRMIIDSQYENIHISVSDREKELCKRFDVPKWMNHDIENTWAFHVFSCIVKTGKLPFLKALEDIVGEDVLISVKSHGHLVQTAAIQGHFDMFEYLYEQEYEMIQPTPLQPHRLRYSISRYIIQAAGCTSHHKSDIERIFSFIQKMLEKYQCGLPRRAIIVAVGAGNIELVKHFIQDLGLAVTAEYVEHAIHCGQYEMEEFLRQYDFE